MKVNQRVVLINTGTGTGTGAGTGGQVVRRFTHTRIQVVSKRGQRFFQPAYDHAYDELHTGYTLQRG